MAVDRFWTATERAEENFTGVGDVTWFRRRMLRLGHEASIIRDRVETIHPDLVGQFDRLEKRRAGGSHRQRANALQSHPGERP
ncbi:hypothetical protein M9978_02535 [Sphingomonas sp. MG17]|uniref:Uncharacterized protein n=1 Tax=Sphingomonas tagetis TaxID=2949092 RepID=A0A9X2KJB6_9SPHN|nr:hypothetical protein [Sphingomonas tagetis]MCP3729294.1 hypothetical protein [Sphingomonas tagetis]